MGKLAYQFFNWVKRISRYFFTILHWFLKKKPSITRYSGQQVMVHNFRWVLNLALLLVVIFEVAEGVISDSNDPDSTNYHTFVPQCLAFVGALTAIIYYHKVEIWNSPKFLLALLIYWPSSFSLKFLKVFSMYKNDITWRHLKMWLAWTVIILYILLFLVELNLLRLQARC